MAAPKKTAEAPAPAEEAVPRETAEEPETTEEVEHPRPWRVEPFSDGKQWAWRLAAADGTVITESPFTFESAERALDTARDDQQTEGAVFPRRQV
jgi:hypothetical protein